MSIIRLLSFYTISYKIINFNYFNKKDSSASPQNDMKGAENDKTGVKIELKG